MKTVSKKELFIDIISKLSEKDLVEIISEMKRKVEIEINSSQKEFFSMDDSTKRKYELYKSSADIEHKKWATTISQIPKSLYFADKDIKSEIVRAKKIWENDVCGNHHIRDKLLLHLVEYNKTHKTTPIIFVGEPGCGKTHMAQIYVKMLGLKLHFVNCPQETTHGHSLYGESQGYKEAGEGILIKAAIKTATANPGVVFNEIDKAISSPNHPNIQNDLLSLLDETNTSLMDNYCAVEYDASQYVVAFTANDINEISAPLKDRCEIIYVDQPDEAQMIDIITKKTYSQLIKEYSIDDSYNNRDIISNYISERYNMGEHSVRKFQSCIKSAVSTAYLRSLSNEDNKFEITKEDLDSAFGEHSIKKQAIGFR